MPKTHLCHLICTWAAEHGMTVTRVCNSLASIVHTVEQWTAYCRKGYCKIMNKYYSTSVSTQIWQKLAAILFSPSFPPILLCHVTFNDSRQNTSLSLGWMQMPLSEQLAQVLMIFLTKQKLRVHTSIVLEMRSQLTTCEWK